MKRITVAHITKAMTVNGISTVISNYCSYINKNKFDVKIITGNSVDKMYVKICKEHNIELIVLDGAINNPLRYYWALFNTLRKKKIDIVHIHGNSTTITVELILATLAGIKSRIAHSHNSTCSHKKIHYVLKPIFNCLYTKGFACSSLAGDWMFGKGKYTVIKNGFDISRFFYSQNIRENIRKELGIENKFAIVNVARFNEQKNHAFLLDIFNEIAYKRDDVCLLLVGDGPLLNSIKAMIDKNQYKDRILYLGTMQQVEKIYNAGDVFLLPTKYEGLGIVFIEAQINGLPVVTSNMVPKEVNIGGMTHFLSLKEIPEVWATEAIKKRNINRNEVYSQYTREIQRYDIKKIVLFLEDIYYQIYKKDNL